ncbi:TIM barrel protein [Candidatus Poribacteria bacterium]|nr:TIM barrel protein [Candidatus Poribacteria bacterium]
MKFSICNEMFENWNWEDVFEYAGDLGYDGVEVAHFTLCDSVSEVSKTRREQLRIAADDAGVDIVGIHWVFVSPKGLHISHPDKTIRDKSRDYLHELVDFCGDLGGKVIVFGSPKNRNVVDPLTPEQAWDYARETFAACCDHARERDVIICIEPLATYMTDYINMPEDGARLVDEINHPNFKMILDTYAMACNDVDMGEAIVKYADYMAHFHINDDNESWPGTGSTDFEPVAKALKKIKYDGYVSVEVFDFNPDPETIAKESMKALKDIFGA